MPRLLSFLGLNFDISKKAFARVHDTRYLRHIQKVEEKQEATGERDPADVS